MAQRGTSGGGGEKTGMKRRGILVGCSVFAALLICVGVLWALHDYTMPVFVDGGVLARRVDADLGNLIAARFPGVRVGAARCPRIVDLTAHRWGRCAIPVAGAELRVAARWRENFSGVEFFHVDALFVSRDAEHTLAQSFAERFGERFHVRCPDPPVRVVAGYERIACAVDAPDQARRDVEVTPKGYFGEVAASGPDLPSRLARVLGRDAEQRKEGSLKLAGHALEQYVAGSAAAEARGEVGRRHLVGAVHCPARIVLHEGTHATCTVRIGALTQRYDVHFEKGLGLRIDTDHSVAVVPALTDVAYRYFRRPAYSGKPKHVFVSCGLAAVVFVEPGSSLPCEAFVDGDAQSFDVHIDDPQGAFSIDRYPAR